MRIRMICSAPAPPIDRPPPPWTRETRGETPPHVAMSVTDGSRPTVAVVNGTGTRISTGGEITTATGTANEVS